MAQYGGEQLTKPEGHQTEEHAHNPLHSTTAAHDIGGTGATTGMGAGHDCQEAKHGGDHVDEHKSSTTATVGDGVGLGKYDGHENKGMIEKIKEKLPGGEHGGDEHKSSATTTVDGGVGVGECEGAEGHEKKGLMEKIKEKLPGGNQ